MVATPIGNLEDMTLRAIRVLKEVDFIACEDTRVSGKLLKHYEIDTKLISLHSHSKDNKYELILNKLINGESIAYITDAGTPGVSDPGQRLVAEILSSKSKTLNKSQITNSKHNEVVISSKTKQSEGSRDSSPAVQNDIQIVPIPGASAVATAVSVSDLVNKEFYFVGFLPKKKGRQTKFKELINIEAPIIIYESALRLERTLKDVREFLGEDAEVFIAREMTKMFEECWGGNIISVILDLKNHKMKGEIVLIVKKSR